MSDIITGFREHLRGVRGRATRTVASYTVIARSFLEFAHEEPNARALEQFLAVPSSTGAPLSVGTRNQRLAALRAFAQYAVAEHGWPENFALKIPFLREPPRDPAVLSVSEVHLFFRGVEAVSPEAQRSRDRAMLALLFTLGLRVHELVALNVGQMDMLSATLLGVRGKGGSFHDLPVEATTLALVQAWLGQRGADPIELALFVSRRGTRLSVRSVQRLFERLRRHVGTHKRVTPHTARHTFVTVGSQRGAEIAALASVARHRDINTTKRYLHLGGAERRRVVNLLAIVIPPEISDVAKIVRLAESSKRSLDAQDHLDDAA